MISLEKTRQSLKSMNLAVIILNGIFAAVTIVIIGFALLGLSMANNPEYQAQLQAQLTPEQLAALKQANPLLEIGTTGLIAVLYIVVAILALFNRKKINANQPSLLPYYIGIGGIVLNFSTYLIQGMVPPIFALIIQGGLLALYIFSIQKAKLLLDNSTPVAE